MLIRFFIAVLFLVLALLAGALLLPAQVHVERMTIIERPPSVVFGLLNDFQHFQAWSPWAERDPNMRYSLSGPERGVGARMTWDGDPRQVGKGAQQITHAEPYSMIRTHLEFDGQGEADAYFDIRPEGRGTRLEWGFDTDVTEDQDFLGAIMGKYMGLFFDHWIGTDYELGLDRFKQYAESFPNADYADIEIEHVSAGAQPILYVPTSSAQSDGAVAAAMGAAVGEISRFMASRGLEHAGMPMSISQSRTGNGYQFDAAIPVESAEVRPTGNIRVGWSPSGDAVRAVHQGAYSSLDETYAKVSAYLAVNRLEPTGVTWEHYISDPGDTDEDELITHVYFLLAPQSAEG